MAKVLQSGDWRSQEGLWLLLRLHLLRLLGLLLEWVAGRLGLVLLVGGGAAGGGAAWSCAERAGGSLALAASG